MMQASPTEDQKEVVYVKGFRGQKIEFDIQKTNTAHTITAAMAHGMQNLGTDLILCKKK